MLGRRGKQEERESGALKNAPCHMITVKRKNRHICKEGGRTQVTTIWGGTDDPGNKTDYNFTSRGGGIRRGKHRTWAQRDSIGTQGKERKVN